MEWRDGWRKKVQEIEISIEWLVKYFIFWMLWLSAVNYLSVYVNRFCGNGAFGLLNSFVNDFGGSRSAKLFA